MTERLNNDNLVDEDAQKAGGQTEWNLAAPDQGEAPGGNCEPWAGMHVTYKSAFKTRLMGKLLHN